MMARTRRIIIDSDDESPRPKDRKGFGDSKHRPIALDASPEPPKAGIKTTKQDTVVRRRKLGGLQQNPLLQPWTKDSTKADVVRNETASAASRPRVKLRTRRSIMTSEDLFGGDDGEVSAEEATILEDVTLGQDSDVESQGSEEDEEAADREGEDEAFDQDDDSDESYDSDDSFGSSFHVSPPPKARTRPKDTQPSTRETGERIKPRGTKQGTFGSQLEQGTKSQDLTLTLKLPTKGGNPMTTQQSQDDSTHDNSSSVFYSAEEDLSGPFSRLDINSKDGAKTGGNAATQKDQRPKTPPLTPPKKTQVRKGLVSPSKKIPRIPATPHHHTSDTFWDQEAVDDWNMTHSPRKLFQPEPPKSPSKTSPTKKTNEQRETKKLFEQGKHEAATKFLRELDHTITGGKLGELAASTGGVQIKWTKQLNTTAGRAKWRRETIRTKPADGSAPTIQHRHHASIELAEKVIDDEQRLLNVVAHEFCHLANFMVTGQTKNPHGKEFKAWAAKCKKAFGDRGINVTTSHSYDIDFKYIWECTECALEYKRHSKSIHPERQRCGACKGHLKQTKPAPRATAGASKYQTFMKEQMKVIKKENPGSPQKEIMKQVAERWAKQGANEPKKGSKSNVDEIAAGLIDLTI